MATNLSILNVNSRLGWRLNGGNSKTTTCVIGSLLVSLFFLNLSCLLIEHLAMGTDDISTKLYYLININIVIHLFIIK